MLALSVVALSVVLLTAGCGASELSDTQLRARAGVLCAVANRQTSAIATPHSPAGASAYLSRGIAVLRPELAGLRALKPPSDLAQVYAISITAFSHKLGALRSAMRHIKAGADPAGAFKALQRRLAPLETSENGAWEALQVPACLNR